MKVGDFIVPCLYCGEGRRLKTLVSRGKEREWIMLENPYTYVLCYYRKASVMGSICIITERPYCEDVGIRSRHINSEKRTVRVAK
jgi:hypothetical protein